MTGTAAEVTPPVRELDDRQIGEGKTRSNHAQGGGRLFTLRFAGPRPTLHLLALLYFR